METFTVGKSRATLPMMYTPNPAVIFQTSPGTQPAHFWGEKREELLTIFADEGSGGGWGGGCMY